MHKNNAQAVPTLPNPGKKDYILKPMIQVPRNRAEKRQLTRQLLKQAKKMASRKP